MEEFYLVVRCFWNYQNQQSNSIEKFTDFNAAKKRFYTILGSDIGKDTVAYEIVTILDRYGMQLSQYTANISNISEESE